MIYFIILLAVISRFVPHLNNFAPITALAIFSAVYLPRKQAIAIPLVVRFVSDVFLGFFSWPLMLAVYGAHLSGVLFGLWIKNNKLGFFSKTLKVLASSLGASVVFFLVTNFAFLYAEYPHTWAGIISAYVNGLPFLRGTVIGDLSYVVALFGAYEVVLYLVKQKSVQKQLV